MNTRLKQFLELVQLYFLRWRTQRARIDINAKCPSCGHRLGMIKYSYLETQRRNVVIHTCLVDGYEWAEPTILDLDAD